MPVTTEQIHGIIYLSFDDCLSFLRQELAERFGITAERTTVYGNLVHCPDVPTDASGRCDASNAHDASGRCDASNAHDTTNAPAAHKLSADNATPEQNATSAHDTTSAHDASSAPNTAAQPAPRDASSAPNTAAQPAPRDASITRRASVPFWCKTALVNPQKITFASVGEAANALKSMQRNWASYQFTLFRRAALIQDKLPYINTKPRAFPYTVPRTPMGAWTLLDEHTMIASAQTTSFFPLGTVCFTEDHVNPPSRAYLKLQEAIVQFESIFGTMPQAGERCFDAGACPGGWTWVLVQLGCSVFAVDRSPLDARLMQNPLVRFTAHDAFTLKPSDIGPFDWVFSDVICYPARLLEWVKMWLTQPVVPNMICTIKMQGKTDWDIITEFAALPDSRVVHLNYNKHEFTWMHKGTV